MKKALLISLIVAPILLATLVVAHLVNASIDRKREADLKAQEEAKKQEEARIIVELRKEERLKELFKMLVHTEMWNDEKFQAHCDFPRMGTVQAVVIDDIDPQAGVGKYFAFQRSDRIKTIGGTSMFLSFSTWDDQKHETLVKLKGNLMKLDTDKPVVVERGGKAIELRIIVPPMPDEKTLLVKLDTENKKAEQRRRMQLASLERAMNGAPNPQDETKLKEQEEADRLETAKSLASFFAARTPTTKPTAAPSSPSR